MTPPDPLFLRKAFGQYPTGVTVVTTRSAEGAPVGFTANSFASVSLDPPMLLVCPGKFLSTFEIFATCRNFAVSVLAEGQEEIANIFATRGTDRFDGLKTETDAASIPLIPAAAATFSCETESVTDAGDHAILLGRVTAATVSETRGLGYAFGHYFSLGLERSVQGTAARNTVFGMVIQLGDAVLLEQTPLGLQPPVSTARNHGALRDALEEEMQRRGITGQLGAVFSVFDDPVLHVQHAYLLAEATAVSPDSGLVAVPMKDLAGATFTSQSIRTMMLRYVAESETGLFTLYLGNTEAGGIHYPKGER